MKFYPTCTLLIALAFSSCSTISKFRKDPSEWGGSNAKTKELAEKAKDNSNPKLTAPKLTAQKRNKHSTSTPTPELPNNTGRTVDGLLEPENITKLPTAEDLKETETATPKNNTPQPIIPQP